MAPHRHTRNGPIHISPVDQLVNPPPVYSEVSKRGWREGVGSQWHPKCSKKCPPELCSPTRKGGIGKKVQRKGLNLWHGRDFLVPTPSVRQHICETSDFCVKRVPFVKLAFFLQQNGAFFWAQTRPFLAISHYKNQ